METSSRRIVAVERTGKRGRRTVTFDDGRELEFSAARVRDAGLSPGTHLDESAIESLARDDARETAHALALRTLAARARSEQEIRLRLRQRGIDGETIDREVRRLRMAGLLNDEQFAESWVESRQRHSARSSRALAGELRAKGVDRHVAEEATSAIDDGEAAMTLARGRWARMAGLDDATRERRLVGLLQRRGFSHEVVARVLRSLAADGP
jgi:regulatory protein